LVVDKDDGSRKEQRLECRTDNGLFGASVLAKKFPAPQRWMVEEEMRLDIPFALDLPVSLLQTPTQNYSRRPYRASSNTSQSWVSHLRPAHLARTCQRDEGLCGDRQAKKVIEC
jgi:hypothetical protein